jgi:ketosteroid isomerase-like protein
MDNDGTSSVDIVRAGYEALSKGDIEAVLAQWHPDVVYWGYDAQGLPREFHGTDEFFGMLGEAMANWDDYTNELGDAHAVGRELVMCHVRASRKRKGSGESQTFDFVQVLQVHEGRIVRGADLLDTDTQHFFRSIFR